MLKTLDLRFGTVPALYLVLTDQLVESDMLVNRNPFAREGLHRQLVPSSSACSWCGCHCRTAKLWEYRVEPDSIGARYYRLNGLFCSASCFRSFHEV